MGKVTSKYQVSIPRRLAERLRIEPGDEIDWSIAGEELRITRTAMAQPISVEAKLKMFDAATLRQASRNRRAAKPTSSTGRGWTREELYQRGRGR
jgi:AbrB family looped-hinge helix DNA binding protein